MPNEQERAGMMDLTPENSLQILSSFINDSTTVCMNGIVKLPTMDLTKTDHLNSCNNHGWMELGERNVGSVDKGQMRNYSFQFPACFYNILTRFICIDNKA